MSTIIQDVRLFLVNRSLRELIQCEHLVNEKIKLRKHQEQSNYVHSMGSDLALPDAQPREPNLSDLRKSSIEEPNKLAAVSREAVLGLIRKAR